MSGGPVDAPVYEIGRADLGALAGEILGSGRSLRFRAPGSSMRPFIRDGDVLEVQPADASDIRRGDVILFLTMGDRVVAHRVIWASKDALMTQGDALARPDGRIGPEQVLGRVVAVERGGQRIRLDVGRQRWLGRLWLAFSPVSRWSYRLLAGVWRRVRSGAPRGRPQTHERREP
ncbi:MAG: S24/S26 family peptidase [Chloroflexi bacterium]|nr:S24/S26 family peptidase [Chloroflexota bacterium]MBU1751366.1 S24/S26 family peptidase [Chloroflexota bacterium]